MSGRPLTYDSSRNAVMNYQAYERKPLKSPPELGDVVYLAVPSPPMIVVDVPVPNPFAGCEPSPIPFGAPIGVVYCDATGHLSSVVVPFGVLVASEVKEHF